jgi:hypothetical protein
MEEAEKADPGAADNKAESPGKGVSEEKAVGADEPRNEEDALAQLRGESSSRPDFARAVEIISRRLKLLEEADVRVGTVNMFNAAVDVGGDFNTGGDSRRARRGGLEVVEPAHLVDYTTAYVPPGGYDDALAVLRETHLLVLAAGVGNGREAATFSLVTDVLGAGAEVFTVPVFDHVWAVPETRGRAYVADASATALLDDAWLTGTSERLRASDSYLVLRVNRLSGPLAGAARRADFVVDSLRAPDPVLIVRARIVHAGVTTEATVDDFLAEIDVRSVVAERPRPRFAAQVAAAIVEATAAGQDVRAALDELNDPLGQADEWFSDHIDPEQIAFAVATAVLEESSYLTLSDAAVALFKALAPAQANPPPLRFRRRMAAEQPWIELAPGSPAVVRFRSPLMQSVVLDYAWYELDGMRPALQKWLRDMAAHPDVEVRARAAAAAGMIAVQDFQHALHHFIRPWASSTSFVIRHSAAVALSVIGTAPSHTERIWTLLRQWTSEVHLAAGKRLASTAGSTAGGPLGVADPVRALRVLGDLVEVGDWTLLEPVVLSVFQLVDGGRTAEVLDALLDWTEQDSDAELVVKGLTAFAFTVREQAIASTGEGWPLLLTETEKHFAALAELWGRALSCRPVRELAIDALREWVRVVDRDRDAFAALLGLLGDVADRGDRDFERLHYHLDRWQQDEEDPSPAAGWFRDALTEPR